MGEQSKKRMTWSAVLLTVCGTILLILLVGMLFIRYRLVEAELDRMLTESLTAHTVEAGDGAGYLIRSAWASMKNLDLLIQEENTPDKEQVELTIKTFNLVDNRMELSYLDSREMIRALWSKEDPDLLRQVRAGESAVSGLLVASDGEEPYLVVLEPVEWENQTAGVLQAKIYADTLINQGQHSTFFHNVHSVIAGNDGIVIYASDLENIGSSLTQIGVGISGKNGQSFDAAYQAQQAGAFNYDPAGGRCYVAWAPVGYHSWRVVQFSQSPTVQIERSSMVQAAVMLVSLVVCGILAAMLWRQRARLAEEKLRYDTLAQFRDTLLFEYDCKDDSLEFTSNALETLELDSARLVGITDKTKSFPVFHPEEMAHVRDVLSRAKEMPPDQIEHDRTRMKKRDGGYSWYRTQYKAVCTPEGKVIRVIGTLTDISAQIVREMELRQQAQQDPLTGLYNRAGVELIDARLEQISRGILFMLDLDDFKHINDSYGHAAGDKVLVSIGHILEETFRTDDIVARVGGDEFVAFLSGSDNTAMAQEKAHELLERVRGLKIEGIHTQISVSIGIASAPHHGRTYESLSASADEAMYDIKNSGKGGFALR